MGNQDVRSTLREFVKASFRYELGDDEEIFELGFVSSMFALQLVEFVESSFGIEVEDDDLDIENFRTVNKIAELVARKAQSIAA